MRVSREWGASALSNSLWEYSGPGREGLSNSHDSHLGSQKAPPAQAHLGSSVSGCPFCQEVEFSETVMSLIGESGADFWHLPYPSQPFFFLSMHCISWSYDLFSERGVNFPAYLRKQTVMLPWIREEVFLDFPGRKSDHLACFQTVSLGARLWVGCEKNWEEALTVDLHPWVGSHQFSGHPCTSVQVNRVVVGDSARLFWGVRNGVGWRPVQRHTGLPLLLWPGRRPGEASDLEKPPIPNLSFRYAPTQLCIFYFPSPAYCSPGMCGEPHPNPLGCLDTESKTSSQIPKHLPPTFQVHGWDLLGIWGELCWCDVLLAGGVDNLTSQSIGKTSYFWLYFLCVVKWWGEGAGFSHSNYLILSIEKHAVLFFEVVYSPLLFNIISRGLSLCHKARTIKGTA